MLTIFDRIVDSPESQMAALKLVVDAGYENPKNPEDLKRILSSYAADSKDIAWDGIANIHPDKELLLVWAKKNKFSNACGCTSGFSSCSGKCSCGKSSNAGGPAGGGGNETQPVPNPGSRWKDNQGLILGLAAIAIVALVINNK